MISQSYLLKEMSNLLKANMSISIQKTNTFAESYDKISEPGK